MDCVSGKNPLSHFIFPFNNFPQKTATAVAYCKNGKGLIKVNGCPIEHVEPEILRIKTYEPVLLLGQDRFSGLDIRVRVKGGGKTAQIYAIRQAIAKAVVAYNQKCKSLFEVAFVRVAFVLCVEWVLERKGVPPTYL